MKISKRHNRLILFILIGASLMTASSSRADNPDKLKKYAAVNWTFAASASVGAYFLTSDYYEGISWGQGFELGARVKLSSRVCFGFAYARPSYDVGEIILQGPGDQLVVLSPEQTGIETNRYTIFIEGHTLTEPGSDLFFRGFYGRFGFSIIEQELVLELTEQNQTDLETPFDRLSGDDTDYGLDFGVGLLIPFADIGYFDVNGTFRAVFYNKETGEEPWGEEPSFAEKVGTAANFDFAAGLMIKF